MHDRIAELRGFRNELAHCENGPRSAAAKDVRAEITRVRGELEKQADQLEEQAKEHTEQGQEGLGGQVLEQARAIREALAADDALNGRGGPRGKETAADSRPKQTAAGRGGKS